jgi:hypothetical protein
VAASNQSTVRTYLSLFIACDGDLDSAQEELEKYGLRATEYVDNRSPERLKMLKRLQDKGVAARAKPLRHNWLISSQDRVKKEQLEPHFLWVFRQIKQGKKLGALKKKGFRIQPVSFWETSDFGGGPIVTEPVSRLLQYHQLELQVDIYPASPSS